MVLHNQSQHVIYDPGVGTLKKWKELKEAIPTDDETLHIMDTTQSSFVKRLVVRVLGLAFGYGTEQNIRELYRELATRYKPGDRVYLFGFSRGAFTVRSLAGLIYRCGLVQATDQNKIDRAYRLYRKHLEQARNSGELRNKKLCIDKFRQEDSRPCNIRFLGIFDTVKSVGYLRPKNLPHTRHNPIVQTVRHALSLDERRSFYVPTTWGGLDFDTRPAIYVPARWGSSECSPPAIQWQDVKEVWFAGNHSDVGGGYPRPSPSANVSLNWMLEEARTHGLLISDNAGVRAGAEVTKEDLHDEMTRRGTWGDLACRILWRGMDHCPRRDLDNEPPPPRKKWRFKPAGKRNIGASLRGGTVAIHSSAKSCYAHSKPWDDLSERQLDWIH